ncbi:hypothetical protein DICPUDRAFT_99176 [Dictyostelium purpureum]|uniref:Threonine/serine exporter-like N-terminal domain-containing protein n=1 Tax=Dictyostelium purpureum TaxID=5786 RepID=F0ZWV3_DICPU|nr:uncharacterized protein DICPUDRAFT_99176 [Dictyostelium purpureum]EGC31580.1 hypothetical protein DICPUDRAFT_99176 [Dictyostelium purpureum]|eukprot:XP_003291891.1 hypothetical protein DICPUDRAFT_99176 [Dictyostelium purpureum]
MYNFFDRIKVPLTDYRKNHPHKKDDDYVDIEDQINKGNYPNDYGSNDIELPSHLKDSPAAVGPLPNVLKQSQYIQNNLVNPLSLPSALIPPPNVHPSQQQLSTSNLSNLISGGGINSGNYNPLNGSVLNCSELRPFGSSDVQSNLTSTRSIQRDLTSTRSIQRDLTSTRSIPRGPVSPPVLSATSNVVAVPGEHINDAPIKTVASPTITEVHANHELPNSEINKNNDNVQSLIEQSNNLQLQMQTLIQNLASLQQMHNNLTSLQKSPLPSPSPQEHQPTSPLLVSPKQEPISPSSGAGNRRRFHQSFQPFQDIEEQEHPVPHSVKIQEPPKENEDDNRKGSTDIEMNELFGSNSNIDNNRINSSNAINRFGVFYNHNLEDKVKEAGDISEVESTVQVSPTFSQSSSGHSRRKSISIPLRDLNKYRDSINELNNAHASIVNNDGNILIVGDEEEDEFGDDNTTKKTVSVGGNFSGGDFSGVYSGDLEKLPSSPQLPLPIVPVGGTMKIPKLRSKFNKEKMQKFKKSVKNILAPDMTVPVHIVDAEQTEAKVVPFLMELGRALLMSGVPSNRLEYELTLISGTFGIDGHFFSTPTGIFFSFGSPHSILSPYTHFLRINSTSYNMERMIQLEDLADEIIYGKANCNDGLTRLREILLKKPIYNIYLSVLSYVISSFTIAFFFNAGWYEVGGCSIIGLYVGLLSLLSSKFSTVGRVLEALSAAGGSFIASIFNAYIYPVPIFIVTLGGIIALAPGLSLTVSIAEISTRNLVSGISRLVGVFACLLQLTFGVVLGTKVSAQIFPLRDEIAPNSFPSWSIWCVIIPAAISFSSQLNVHPRQYWVIVVSSCIGVAFGNYTTEYFGDVGSFFGAFAICVCGNLYSRFSNVSPICSIFSGIILLVPGSMGVKGMFAISNGDLEGGTSFFTGMFFIAISLTMGLLIANLLVPPPKSM